MLRKVIALVLSAELCKRLEPGLLEYQCGFRPQRGCADQLFTLRKLSELAVEWQQRLYVAFVDLRKAFDSISRPALWAVLRSRGVPEDLLSAVADLHTDTICSVRVGNARSRPFRMEFGVQQGCPLASVLFNVYFDHVVREALAACPDAGIEVRRRSAMEAELLQPEAGPRGPALEAFCVPVLMLADDLAVLAPTAEALQRFLTAFEAACVRWGLVISTDKTELMLIGGAAAARCEGCGSQQGATEMMLCDGCERAWHTGCLPTPLPSVPPGDWLCPACATSGPRGNVWQPPILVAGAPLEWVDKFKYLGIMFTSDGGLDTDLARRVQLAAAAFRQLERPFFQQKCIPMGVRMMVYTAMVVSVLLYGSEAWALTQPQLQMLEVFHRARLRMILGVRLADRIPIPELLRRCGTVSIRDMLDRRQLRWLGHIARMGPDRLARHAFYSTMAAPGRCRRVGHAGATLCDAYRGLVQRRLGRDSLVFTAYRHSRMK